MTSSLKALGSCRSVKMLIQRRCTPGYKGSTLFRLKLLQGGMPNRTDVMTSCISFLKFLFNRCYKLREVLLGAYQ